MEAKFMDYEYNNCITVDSTDYLEDLEKHPREKEDQESITFKVFELDEFSNELKDSKSVFQLNKQQAIYLHGFLESYLKIHNK